MYYLVFIGPLLTLLFADGRPQLENPSKIRYIGVSDFANVRSRSPPIGEALGATDLRFFRAALDMNSKAFAEVMQLTPETVSRWEAENGKGVGHSSETSVRLCVLSLLREQAPFIACNPADIVRMRARPLAEGEALPVLTFERVKVREGGRSRVIWEERLAA